LPIAGTVASMPQPREGCRYGGGLIYNFGNLKNNVKELIKAVSYHPVPFALLSSAINSCANLGSISVIICSYSYFLLLFKNLHIEACNVEINPHN
jgi:hypothetical protein